VRLGQQLAEPSGICLERVGRDGAGFRDVGTQREIFNFARDELAHITSSRARLAQRPVDVDSRRQFGACVASTVFEQPRHRAQSGTGGAGELRLRIESMPEQREDTAEARIEIDLRLTAPHQPVVQDGAAAQERDDQIAVDAFVESGAVRIEHCFEAAQPLGGAAAAILERGLGEVIELIVAARDAQLARQDRRIVKCFVKKARASSAQPGMSA
jgi:hypothetical protein